MASNDNQALLLQVSADLSKLEKAFQRAQGTVDKGSDFMERRAKRMAQKIEDSAGKVNVQGALAKVFDRSRLAVIDQGAARIGVFGSAIEELGPYGIAAAAGVAALTAAMAGAREAAKFADDIADTANRLHVTTDALQEYRYAIRAAGGDEAGADQALEAFSSTLGKAQAGLPKAIKAFKELGFTRKDIDGFKDVQTALDAVSQKIAGLSNVQKDAVIDQLGLTGLKPLIASGVDEMHRLREEAHRVGIVMDAELVKRGGDLNDEFETLEKVIDVQLKSALVDLGPILVSLLGLIARMAEGAADIADHFRDIDQKSNRGLQKTIDNDVAKINAIEERTRRGGRIPIADDMLEDATRKEIAKTALALMRRKVAQATGGPGKPPASLIDPSKTGGGSKSAPRDDTARYDKATSAAQLNAERGLYHAMLSLTDNVESRAALQHQILDVEQRMADNEYRDRLDEINKSNSANKAKQRADLDAAKALQDQARAIESNGIDAQKLIDLDREKLDRAQRLASLEMDELRAQEGLTNSRTARRDLELQILDRQYALDRAARDAEIRAQQLRADAGDPDAVHVVAERKAERDAAEAKHNTDRAAIMRQYEGAIDQFIHGIQSLDDVIQDSAVSGLRELNNTILQVGTTSKSAGAALLNYLLKIIQDIANRNLEKAEAPIIKGAGDFLSGLFGGKSVGTGVKPNTDGGFTPLTVKTPSYDGGGFTGWGTRSGGLDGRGGFNAILHPGETVIDHMRGISALPRPIQHVVAPLIQIGPDASGMLSQQWIDGLNAQFRAVHDSAVRTAVNRAAKGVASVQNKLAIDGRV